MNDGKNVAELSLSGTNPPLKTTLVSESGERIDHKRFLLFSGPPRNRCEEEYIKENKDIDLTKIGKVLGKTKVILVDNEFKPVLNYRTLDVLYENGKEIAKRDHIVRESNVNNEEKPLSIIQRTYSTKYIFQNYLISHVYQVKNISSLGFKFCYNLAKKYEDFSKAQMVRTSKVIKRNGKVIGSPLIFRRDSRIYKYCFLTGSVKKDSYALLLLVSEFKFGDD